MCDAATEPGWQCSHTSRDRWVLQRWTGLTRDMSACGISEQSLAFTRPVMAHRTAVEGTGSKLDLSTTCAPAEARRAARRLRSRSVRPAPSTTQLCSASYLNARLAPARLKCLLYSRRLPTRDQTISRLLPSRGARCDRRHDAHKSYRDKGPGGRSWLVRHAEA